MLILAKESNPRLALVADFSTNNKLFITMKKISLAIIATLFAFSANAADAVKAEVKSTETTTKTEVKKAAAKAAPAAVKAEVKTEAKATTETKEVAKKDAAKK